MILPLSKEEREDLLEAAEKGRGASPEAVARYEETLQLAESLVARTMLQLLFLMGRGEKASA